MINLRPGPIDFEIVLNDAALQKARDIRICVENQPAASQILDLVFERSRRENAAIFQFFAKRFRVFRPPLDLLEPEGFRIGADRRPQNGGDGVRQGGWGS